MEGQPINEIAKRLRILPRSVLRKLALIQGKWDEALDGKPL